MPTAGAVRLAGRPRSADRSERYRHFAIGQVGLITRWTPVKNLTFSADFNWTHLDQKMAGTFAYGGAGAIAKPAAVYELKDQDSLTLLLRAQRNW